MHLTHKRPAQVFGALLAGLLLATTPALGQGVADPFGQPKILIRNQPSYYVWVDQAGWHVRWSTAFLQIFSGSVTADGEIRELRRAGGGPPAWLSQSGARRAVFATATAGGVDGFDFQTTGATVTFSLLLNAFQIPGSLVFIGRNSTNPSRVPFSLVVHPSLLQQQQGREPYLSDVDRPATDR